MKKAGMPLATMIAIVLGIVIGGAIGRNLGGDGRVAQILIGSAAAALISVVVMLAIVFGIRLRR